MGTRHLIGVVLDGDFRVAQYGQWDGYPSGQGADVLDFLRTADLDTFSEKVRALRWQTDEDMKEIVKKLDLPDGGYWDMDQATRFQDAYPHLTRDAGADILTMINEGGVEFVTDSREFAKDSLFCEWAYVVDLDRRVLEAYKGYVKGRAPIVGRWAGKMENPEHRETEYGAVELLHEFKISDLPTTPEFCEILEPREEE